MSERQQDISPPEAQVRPRQRDRLVRLWRLSITSAKVLIFVTFPVILGAVVIAGIWIFNPRDMSAAWLALASMAVLIVVTAFALNRSYAPLLHTERWKFNLYFDLEGLKLTIRRLTADERLLLNIDENWTEHSANYVEEITNRSGGPGAPKAVTVGRDSEGVGTFSTKVRKGLIGQQYRITSGGGSIVLAVAGHGNEIPVTWTFDLKPTPADRFELSLRELLVRSFYILLLRTIVVQPTFTQTIKYGAKIIVAPGSVDSEILCHTKIHLHPTGAAAKTIYFVDIASVTGNLDDKSRTMVPVAYAIHRID